MLGRKRSRDSPRRPPESVFPGEGLVGFSDVPTSPIETKVGSTNKWRSKETETEAVGLGIIAALLKSGEVQGKFVVGSPSLRRRCPISVVSRKDSHGNGGVDDKSEVGRSESYTCITCSAQQPSVYCQGNEVGHRVGDEFLQKNRDDGRNSRNMGVFLASPPRFTEDFMGFQTSDFLSYCHLCWKKLHGKDIYMYRGEKAFCSAECRYRQIVSDEYQEKCRSEASEISLPTYTTDVLLPPGIFAV